MTSSERSATPLSADRYNSNRGSEAWPAGLGVVTETRCVRESKPSPSSQTRRAIHFLILYRRSRNGSSRTPQATHPIGSDNEVSNSETQPAEPGFAGVASTASLPVFLDADQSFSSQTATGETIKVTQQIQLYAPNGLLKHPLVSPAHSYLGGLPPLLFIAGDREVLRDEIIYTCALFSSIFPSIR